MYPLLLNLLALVLPAGAGSQPFDHVVIVSVDGLRSDALIAAPRETIPNFRRLMKGPHTLNARTDPTQTVTAPNHICMVTGRSVTGPAGHGWIVNEPLPGSLLRGKDHAYFAGIFDVAHDHGLHTAFFGGKIKFSLFDRTWDGEHGAPDTTGPDDGRDKLDAFFLSGAQNHITDAALKDLAGGFPRSLVFIHYPGPDGAGHRFGWNLTAGSPYMQSVAAVDKELGRVLDAIDSDPALKGRTALLLTADHGGGGPLLSHYNIHLWINYIIPFLVWAGEDGPAADLYRLNPGTRRDPGISNPATGAPGPPPIRNGEIGNLGLQLLGLPAIPGSTLGARHDLVLQAPASAATGRGN